MGSKGGRRCMMVFGALSHTLSVKQFGSATSCGERYKSMQLLIQSNLLAGTCILDSPAHSMSVLFHQELSEAHCRQAVSMGQFSLVKQRIDIEVYLRRVCHECCHTPCCLVVQSLGSLEVIIWTLDEESSFLAWKAAILVTFIPSTHEAFSLHISAALTCLVSIKMVCRIVQTEHHCNSHK